MKKEDFFRAVGEVREDQLAEAERPLPWRRYGALAACLAVVLAAGFALRQTSRWDADTEDWMILIENFNPTTPNVSGSLPEAAGGADAGTGDLDGSRYWTDAPNAPVFLSEGVEIGELDGPGGEAFQAQASADVPWLSPEEIFAQDTVIFRGTVQALRYYVISAGEWDAYYTVADLEITDSIRGGLREGESCSLLYMGAKGYAVTSLSGALADLDVGNEAIFMPTWTNAETGRRSDSSYFCYADLADLYLSEGMRYVFADTGDGLSFERGAYPEIAEAETLDQAAAYIRDMTAAEESRPAGAAGGDVPSDLQTAPTAFRQFSNKP